MAATNIVISATSAYLTHVGAANSRFTGITQVSELGNIEAVTGASTLTEIYSNTAQMQWNGAVSNPAIPTNQTTGQYAIVETLSPVNDLGADYECRRFASLITSAGKLQLAISSNNGAAFEGGNDCRWCLYYPSEDFNQEVLVHEYISTDIADVMAGNNISELLDNITGRMNNFTGNDGPVCNGTSANDLFSDINSIFAKGCLLTWESPATNGDAVIAMAGV
jgi:hypothetical protein